MVREAWQDGHEGNEKTHGSKEPQENARRGRVERGNVCENKMNREGQWNCGESVVVDNGGQKLSKKKKEVVW